MSISGTKARVVDRTANHAIGVYGDIVITYAFRGTVDDPSHLTVTGDLVRTEAERRGRGVRLLVVLAEAGLSRPPSPAVRAVAQKTAERHAAHVSKVALVVKGEGFGSAIHRAVISGMIALLRPAIRPAIVADAGAALAHLLEPGEPSDEVLRFCEHELSRSGG